MQRCEHLYDCAFYNEQLIAMPTGAFFMKQFFCWKESDKCMRNLKAHEVPVESAGNELSPIG